MPVDHPLRYPCIIYIDTDGKINGYNACMGLNVRLESTTTMQSDTNITPNIIQRPNWQY